MEVKRRQSWDKEETRYFLNLIKERKIMKCLDNKKFRANDIFKYLETDMHEKGYEKDWKQMQTRFKTLRQQYNQIKRKMGKSGSGNYLSSFPYTSEMSELLDSRPISIEEGIDSCVFKDSSNEKENVENQCVSENVTSASSNEKNDSNDCLYEDLPDPRDGAIPGCSKDICESTTQCSQSNRMSSTIKINYSSTDSSSSNKTHKTDVKVLRQRSKNKSYESIVMKFANKMQETYEKNQEQVMTQTKENVSKLIDSENKMIDKIMENNRIILNETTNQLLHGLQNIFGVAASTRTVNTQMIPSIVPSFNEATYLYPNELHFQPPTLPKVLVNLKRSSANEEIQAIKIKKLDNYSNSRKEESTENKQRDTNTNIDNKIQ